MKKKRKNNYFTIVHQDAIIAYCRTEDRDVKEQLYRQYIGPAFNELVDKIVFTYKFNNLPNVDDLKDECKIWLTTILDKYDPTKNSKAFSYFSVITKNWFIHKVKKNAKKLKREVYLEEVVTNQNMNELIVHNEYLGKREKYEFFAHLGEEVKKWETNVKVKENEKKVLQAIEILFDTSTDIEIFNKKAIYLYIREITGLNTKQIVNNLNKIRSKYRGFKSDWDDGKF
jgi:DNA-directed RNA polymerase specialized sigma subunit